MTRKPKALTSASTSYIAFCNAIGIPLTPTQEGVAAVAFDGAPVPDELRDLFGFEGPAPTPETRRTIGVLCGRASGKTSTLCAGYVLWRAITADLHTLARGEIAFAPLIAPDRELAKQALRFVTGTLQDSPLSALIEHQDADSVTIRRPDGKRVCISVFAATRGGASVRGKAIVGAALDEACFFHDSSAIVNDRDIFNAITPRLMTGGAVVIASTPWIQSGLLFDLWKNNFGKPDEALVIHAPTERMRTDDPELIARIATEREKDPDNAVREYDCQWLPRGSGSAFDTDSLGRAVVNDISQPKSGEEIYVGGDIGLVGDPSAFVAVRAAPGNIIEVIDVREMRPRRGSPLNLEAVLREGERLCESLGTQARIRVDHHGLEQARQAIESARPSINLTLEPCSESSANRELRFTRLRDAFASGRVKIPKAFASLTDQLAAIVATPRDGGGYSFKAPRREGHHCDAAMALLLACERVFENHEYWENVGALRTAQGAWDFTRLALAVGIRETGSIAGDIEVRDQILNLEARAALGLDARPDGDEDEEEPATSYEEAAKRLWGPKKKKSA